MQSTNSHAFHTRHTITRHPHTLVRDDDSRLAYIAWFLFLVTDVSVLSCVLPATSLLYALLAQNKRRKYWQVWN